MSIEKPRKRTTLADVASEAGVSVQTVSHVISGNITVRLPEATRERVRDAAKKVGYSPNLLAQALKNGKTNIICIWMPIERFSPMYTLFLQEFLKHAKSSGYDLMIADLTLNDALKKDGRLPPVWAVDGIISIDAGKAIEVLRENHHHNNIPIGILGYETCENSDSVTWDTLGAARIATEKLISSGSQKILFLTPKWVHDGYPNERRNRGYSEAMETAGLEKSILVVPSENSMEVKEFMKDWLSENKAPDSFICFSDSIAIGAVRALTKSGYLVPQDTKVWGHGNTQEAEHFKIPISTNSAPIAEIVEKIWTGLIERINDMSLEPRFIELPMESIERESSS